jgi:ABC-type bacteriocin/lantibiotic exporter with double-glycine peptidase domain
MYLLPNKLRSFSGIYWLLFGLTCVSALLFVFLGLWVWVGVAVVFALLLLHTMWLTDRAATSLERFPASNEREALLKEVDALIMTAREVGQSRDQIMALRPTLRTTSAAALFQRRISNLEKTARHLREALDIEETDAA